MSGPAASIMPDEPQANVVPFGDIRQATFAAETMKGQAWALSVGGKLRTHGVLA